MKKLFSTNNPYYDLYAPNAPENANIAGFGDWFSFLRRGNTEQYNDNGMSDIGNNNTNYLNGNSGIRYDQMGSLGQQQQQFDFDANQGNPYTSQMMQTGQPVGEVLDNGTINERKQIEGQQQKQDGNNNGGNSPNWGGVIAAAGTNTINAIRNGGSKAEIAAGIMGIPSFAKMWTYDDATEKKRMNEIKDLASSYPENKTWITDSSSSGGAFNGIKLNTQQAPNLINTSKIKNFTDWKDFSAYHKGKFGKNLGTAMIEGTMSGSVGGPWGMLGGAVTGLFGSLFGRIGAKKRAQRAQNIANSRVNDYRLYYNAENFRRQAEYDLANKNLLNNGLKQQNISEMSNFKAFGGNLYPDGGELPPPLTGDFLDNIRYQTKHPNSFTPEGYTLDNGAKIRAGDFSDWIEDNASWLNYLPFVGTLSDIDKTLADPTIGNAAWALAGLATDIIPLGKVVKAFKGTRAAEPIADLISNGAERNVSTLTRPTIEEYNIMKKTLGKDATSDIMSNIMEGNADGIRTATNNATKKQMRNSFLVNAGTELANDFTNYLTTQEQNEKPNIFKEYYNMPLGSDNEIISNAGAKFHKVRTSKGNVWVDETGKISLTEEEMADNLYNNRGYFNNTNAMGGNLYPDGGTVNISDLFQNAIQKSALTSLYDPYTVKRGETLSEIASRNNMSLEDLISMNQEIVNPSMINVGQQINLPKRFNSEEITDNTSDSSNMSNFSDYTVKQGDYMSKIAKSNNTTLEELREANPQIKDINNIFVGDVIHIPQNTVMTASAPKRMSLTERRAFEEEANKTNLGAIQGYRHENNYAVIDKKNKTITVYSPTNKILYQSSDIATGLSGDDYNTITYADKTGKIENGKGNMSTPAGITEINDIGTYHNQPSYTRKRVGDETDIASSFHAGNIIKGSNGCVRMSDKTLQDLQQFLNKGTRVYTLPEKDGSRFVLKDGKLSFQADNPYGETDGNKKYWDDYNVYNDKTSGDLFISPNENFKNKYKDTEKLGNAVKFGNILSESKDELQKYLGLSSGAYNDLAQLAMGIAEQETKFGDSFRYSTKSSMPWLVNSIKWIKGNNSANSQGITQIKYDADIKNESLKKIYDDLGVTKDSLQTPEGAAKATLARLAFIYKTEILGKKFTGADGIEISPLDALLYKYVGKNSELKNHTATPDLNEYIKNVSTYKNNFDYEGTFAMGGNLYTDLSPNMMNLWNDKQNIDKQKVMNQQMNFGLGNSFNQKLNTFDYGGNLFEGGGVIFNGRLFNQRNDGNYVKYNDPDFVVTKEDMEKALREGLAFIDSGIINWKGRLFERGNDNNYHAVDDPEYILEEHNAEELIRNGEAKNVNSIDVIANNTNKNNTISTPEDLHRAFYSNIGNTNIDTNNIINTPEDLHRAFYGDNSDVDDKDVTDKGNIINTPEDLHKEFYKDDNITAKKTPSKESTEKQKEYYNKKRQSYAEFNKDMGFLNKDDVKRFQEAYNREHEDKLKVDGLTGDKTIKAYQRWVNELNKDNKDKEALKIDGFYGKKSKSANNSDVANRMLNNEDFDINMLNNATVSTNEEPIEEPNIYEQENPEEVYSNEPPELTQEERYNMFQEYMNTPNFLRNPYYDKLTGKPIGQEAILQQGNKFNNITDTNILQHSYGGNLNRFDYGGAMNGMDLPTDMQYYENGGTHEQNPYGGIQVGVDQQGNPNLVEEGEFRYGDKVLSDRLNVNPDILSLFNAPKSKGDKTYAEVGKRLADKAKEGLNDPITKRTLDANMGRLFNSQEYQKKEAELDAQKDQQLAEYKNTLESPTQGNPMYGSMKYSGMGNANQGLNAGVDEGMGNPMDSSDLSNVNRSGNAMMAAYGGMFANGGNLYPYGGYSRTPEDDAQLSFVRPLFNIGNYQNNWTNNNSGNIVRQGGVYDPYDLSVNTNPNIGLNQYEQRYTDEYVDAISKGDPRVRQQILQDEGLYDGKIDGIWGKKSKAAWDEFNRIRKIRDTYGTTQNAQPQQTTTTQTTTTQTNTPTQTTTPTNTSNSNSKSIYVKEKSSGSDVNSALNQAMNRGDKTGDVVANNTANSGIGRINPVEKNGEYGRLEAQPYGLANPNVPWLSEAGKYANLAKYTMPFMTDQKNLTNWKYNINPAPANRLQAKGESSYANRTAEHLGDYVAPNLMDIERLNNAAMAQTAAQQRGTNNISGGNRGFANSQNAAIGFNGQMATGQNYATTNEYNANQKMTAANFNRDTNKFNVDADNEMHKDNLNSWLQGRNMDLNAHIAANQERLNERQYKDRVDRDAALNRQDNLNAMFNNQMNFIADEAKRRRELNEFNTLKNNRFYYDPRSGWNQKDDNGFNFEIADRLQRQGLYGFTGERDTAYKNLLKEKSGANFDKNDWKYIDKLIQMESDAKKHEQELADAKKLEDRNNNLTEIQDIVSALNNTRDFHAWDSQRDYYNGLDYGDMSDEQVKRQLDFLRSIRNNYFNPQYWSNQSKTES